MTTNKALTKDNCLKCNNTLAPHSDEMSKSNGVPHGRKCLNCGKEYPAYPLRGKGSRHDMLDRELYLQSMIGEFLPIHGDHTIAAMVRVLGINKSTLYNIYSRMLGRGDVVITVKKTAGTPTALATPTASEIPTASAIPTRDMRIPIGDMRIPTRDMEAATGATEWARREVYTQPWGIAGMNGLMPKYEEVIVVEIRGRIISRTIREKKTQEIVNDK